jgi:hypothetical protein
MMTTRQRSTLLAPFIVLAMTGLLPRSAAGELRAGAATVDVSPRSLPAICNGGFTERTFDKVFDPLHARAIVLDDGAQRIAIVVVDSCMIPRELCDIAKSAAKKTTGIAIDHILISATHAHSAPSVMDYCLGSRSDPAYTEFLPTKIAEVIELANERLVPVRWSLTRRNTPSAGAGS